MSERKIRKKKGINYWIDRCDEAENIIEEYESNVNRLFNNLIPIKRSFKITKVKEFRLGISKLILLDNIDGKHLKVKPFTRE